MDSPNHIVFCVDNKYAEYLPVLISSIIINNSKDNYTFHILTDYISDKNVELIKKIITSENYTLKFYQINNDWINLLPSKGQWSIHIWYRILIPKILDKKISKVLYLDADTLVVGRLEELFNLDMTNKSIGATPEANFFNSNYYNRLDYNKMKGYICSGVLLMNLDYWRNHNLTEKIMEWVINNKEKIFCPDQDAINYVCQDTKIILPLKYGVVQWYYTNKNFYNCLFKNQLKESIHNPIIIHYAFTQPWYKDSQRHIFHKLWHEYNKSLNRPIKIKYKSKGFQKIKLFIWDLIYPNRRKPIVSLEEIINELN